MDSFCFVKMEYNECTTGLDGSKIYFYVTSDYFKEIFDIYIPYRNKFLYDS